MTAYASQVISDHERSSRATSAASDRARNTCNSLHRTIRSSMELKKTYDDTIRSLEDTCEKRLSELPSEHKKMQKEIIRTATDVKIRNTSVRGMKAHNYFQLPSMLQKKNHHEPSFDKTNNNRIKRQLFADAKG